MSPVPSVKLNSGYDFPLIGYGTFNGDGAFEQVYKSSKYALECGYRHFDTAYIYATEEALGNAIKDSNVDRQDVFITTKLWNDFHEPQHVRPALDRSLKYLQTDYIDLYLMHWPLSFEFKGYEFNEVNTPILQIKPTNVPIVDTWRAMEKLVKDGVVRSIGASNFTIPMLQDILDHCEIPPAVNQIEMHPNLPQEELLEFCNSKGIKLTAFSPLGNFAITKKTLKILDAPVVQELATKYNKTPIQVLLNWGVNRGYAVIPKSVTPSRIKDNLVYFEMDKKDVDAITEAGLKAKARIFNSTYLFGEECTVFSD
ncbi:Aldo/keto reductase [Backusella circina FSU 941]|nr:Aldo/keto reductase [Backusella circina FSU 941]